MTQQEAIKRTAISTIIENAHKVMSLKKELGDVEKRRTQLIDECNKARSAIATAIEVHNKEFDYKDSACLPDEFVVGELLVSLDYDDGEIGVSVQKIPFLQAQ